MKQYYVYMITSANNQALYTGMTNDLERRLYEHKNELADGYTKKYKCKKLVHYEIYDDPYTAISREKDIKGWVRRRKNELIEKNNPAWKNLDPSAQALQDDIWRNSHPEGSKPLKDLKTPPINLERYQRQLALPEIGLAQQKILSQTHIAFIGAGGLGSAALPYLASAGIGKITIIDHDTISISNLHRQTVYKTSEAGRPKAEAMAEYLRALNPEIEITARNIKLCHPEGSKPLKDLKDSGSDPSVVTLLQDDITLLLDGSDNFATKTLLNEISIAHQIPLISASVNQWSGQAGIFAGYAANAPCYHCLFPELPTDARNCNEAGILGTSAGLAGMVQAHLTLLYLLGMEQTGTILTMDFKSLRTTKLNLPKNPDCAHCQNGQAAAQPKQKENKMTEMLSIDELKTRDHIIIDVRTPPELIADPIPHALHMELSSIPTRHIELPKDKLLAFVCAGNIRSAQAAQYLEGLGYNNVCVLDKFSL